MRHLRHVMMLILLSGWLAPAPAAAQDLYDTAVLRTFHLTFHDANWKALLRSNYVSQTYILADLVVDGVTYPNVGVRIRGNTSYTSLPAGSDKFSLKLKLDQVDAAQELLGHDTVNLNNGFRDPTFSREVVYNNFVAQFIPNARANHALVTLNGENWGVYINVQQADKRMLRNYFVDEDGVRTACANNPNGPGLSYNGPAASGYSAYEVQTDGGLADPLATLIAVTNALSNTPLKSWPAIDSVFAIDPSIWSVVLENLLTDDDSYINKGCDFVTYRDPIDGRTHLLQRDANETFTQITWAPTRNFPSTNKPLLNRVLAVPELRQRYMAHYRHARSHLDWSYFGPIFAAHRSLIDAAVQADTKKLYTYANFQNNFSASVNMAQPGLAGGMLNGIEPFVTQRASFLNGNAELSAVGPSVSSVTASSAAPDPSETVWINASVQAAGNPIQSVELFYRPSPTAGYLRTAMADDGASNDGAAGDGVYGVQLPINATPGQRVSWYVGARAANSFGSWRFAPALAERGPNVIEYTLGSSNGVRITEWMYAGGSGEFIEFTNLSVAPIDLTGWSMDDSNAQPGAFSLSAGGTLQPGESLVVTESAEAAFRLAWGLAVNVRVIGDLGLVSGNNLGRNDEIHLFDAAGIVVDRLFYGDQTFPGTIRTQNRSGQADCSAFGTNDVAAWELSALGDRFGSVAATSGDIGTPGFALGAGCGGIFDRIFLDGFE